MKRRILSAILIVLFLAACSGPAGSVPTLPQPSAAPSATFTPTPLPSATPTSTRLPTQTPLPTSTFTPTATPLPETLSSQNISGLQLVRRFGNGRIVQALWSPQGTQLLVLTTVSLKAYDPADGNLLWETQTGSPQTTMAFAPDGASVLTISAGGGLKIWDAASGKAQKTLLEPKEGVDLAVLSSSGGLLTLTNSARKTTLMDVGSGTALATNDGISMPMGLDSVLPSPDGTVFWTSGFDSHNYQQIQAWDAKTGSFLRGLQGMNLDYVVGLAISSDSRWIAGINRLALTSNIEYAFLVWNTASAGTPKKVIFEDDIDAFTFISGAEKALIASYGAFQTVDLISGEIGPRFGKYNSTTLSLSVSPDGKELAAACADGSVQVYDLSAQKLAQEIKLDLSLTVPSYLVVGKNYFVRMERYTGLGAGAGSKFVASLSADRMSILLVDPSSLQVLKKIGKGPFSTFTVSADGSTFATVDETNQISIYNSSGSQRSTFKTTNQDPIKAVEISPDNQLVATLSGGYLGELYVWDASSGKKLSGLSGYNAMKFARDSKTLISDNVDFGLYVWDVFSGKKVASPASDWINDLDFSQDGKTIAVAGLEVHKKASERQNVISFYDAVTHQMLPLQLSGHPSMITEVIFSPDSRLIASADVQGNIRLWDARSGEMLKEIREAAAGPVKLVFLADNRTLVLGSGDGTLSFFQVH